MPASALPKTKFRVYIIEAIDGTDIELVCDKAVGVRLVYTFYHGRVLTSISRGAMVRVLRFNRPCKGYNDSRYVRLAYVRSLPRIKPIYNKAINNKCS